MLPRLVFFPRPTVTLRCASEAWSPASKKWASMPFQDWQDCRGSTGRYGGAVSSGPLSVSWPVPPVSTQPGGRLARAGSTLPSWTPLAGRPAPRDREGRRGAPGRGLLSRSVISRPWAPAGDQPPITGGTAGPPVPQKSSSSPSHASRDLSRSWPRPAPPPGIIQPIPSPAALPGPAGPAAPRSGPQVASSSLAQYWLLRSASAWPPAAPAPVIGIEPGIRPPAKAGSPWAARPSAAVPGPGWPAIPGPGSPVRPGSPAPNPAAGAGSSAPVNVRSTLRGRPLPASPGAGSPPVPASAGGLSPVLPGPDPAGSPPEPPRGTGGRIPGPPGAGVPGGGTLPGPPPRPVPPVPAPPGPEPPGAVGVRPASVVPGFGSDPLARWGGVPRGGAPAPAGPDP